jgi:hypothetical protein
MTSAYFAIRSNPPSQFPLAAQVSNLASTIMVADARNNIVFFNDNNLLYTQPHQQGTAGAASYSLASTVISISLDDMLKVIVIGMTSGISVFAYDNSQLITPSRFTLTNTWSLNYRIFFDPIFFRVIIDLDIAADKNSH